MINNRMEHPPERSSSQAKASQFAAHLAAAQERLFGYIHSLVRDFNDADDLFQQSAIVLWRKFDSFDPSRSFIAWAMGIARFEITNFLRTRGRSRLYFSDDLNLMLIEAQEDMTDDELEARRAALSKCVERLRERDRTLLNDFYGGGLKVIDFAGQVGRSSHSVHNSLRRIRRGLFECIRRTMGGAAPPEVMA